MTHPGLPAPRLLGRAADVVTLARVGMAPLLAAMIGGSRLGAAALVLAAAWVSDVVDGALARAGAGSRLGRWDVVADATVGAAALVGVSLLGVVPAWTVVVAVVVLGGLLVAGNLAAGMFLQLSGYLPLLWMLWRERPVLWWLPVATAIGIGVVEWRKLIEVNIPNFLRGITGRFER